MINAFFKLIACGLVALLMAAAQVSAADTGKLTGGIAHEYPDWFKQSFLDLKEDASEAAAEDKHTILFLSLNGCPYCARMLKESFAQNKDEIIKHFDTIGLNIRGDRMVMVDGESEVSEKDLARKWRVRFTPTVLFLDEAAKPVFRINGYWDPAQFRMAMAYVRTRSYKDMEIGQFMAEQKTKSVWNFAKHPALSDTADLSKSTKPILVLFEDPACTACAELHADILARKDVSEALAAYTFVRLNAEAETALTDPAGASTTAKAWAKTLGVRASPTFVAFDEGQERQRFDSKLYSHHFISILAYVSGKHYKTHDTWLKYNTERTDKILATGQDVDLSDGQSHSNQ